MYISPCIHTGASQAEGDEKKAGQVSEYGQFAIPFVEEEDDDSDSDVGERVTGGEGIDAGWGRVLDPEQGGNSMGKK